MFLPLIVVTFTLAAADPISFTAKEDGRIMGGIEVAIEQFPHQVSLHLNHSFHTCGGSIISTTYVLTAAHCVENFTQNIFFKSYVRCGSNYTGCGGSIHFIREVKIHEDYGKYLNRLADLAIVKVFPPFEFGSSCEPVKLCPDDFLPEQNELISVSGFGTLSMTDRLSKRLMAVTVPVIDLRNCKELYMMQGQIVQDDAICAGCPEGGMDACMGDSGGAAMLNGQQVGIVSWGDSCGEPGIPGVYMSVGLARDWIRKYSGV